MAVKLADGYDFYFMSASRWAAYQQVGRDLIIQQHIKEWDLGFGASAKRMRWMTSISKDWKLTLARRDFRNHEALWDHDLTERNTGTLLVAEPGAPIFSSHL